MKSQQSSKSITKSLVFDRKQQIKKNELTVPKNKSSLLDISVENEDSIDESSPRRQSTSKKQNIKNKPLKMKFKTNANTLEQFSPLSSPTSNKQDAVKMPVHLPFSQAFLQDFKQYLDYRQQKKQLQKSQLDPSDPYSQAELASQQQGQFNRLRQQQQQQQQDGNNNSNELEENNNKQQYNQKVQKHKEQTKKIMQEINKKLKIQGKSKIERFEDQMQVFKNTDTYIEIKPFLEQLNIINHSKFIQQIQKYEQNIKLAQQYQQQDNFLKNSSQVDSNIYINTIKRSDEISMRKFEDIISKAYATIIKSDNFKSYKLLQSNIIEKLMEELGYDQNNNDQQKQMNTNNNDSQFNDSTLADEQKYLQTKDNNPQQQKNKGMKQNEQQNQQQNKQKPKPNLDVGDLTSDDNQFFVNLKDYLNKAQKDINLKIELETEFNTYAEVIEENERKIEEAKQQQVKKFMNGKLDPQNLFEGDRDIELKQYYERFREKAEQVRSTLHKVNQELFQKKWANAQIKRKMERQKERNHLLSKFKNNKQENADDFLNPSKRMNEKLLRNRNRILQQQLQQQYNLQNNMSKQTENGEGEENNDDSQNQSQDNINSNSSRNLKMYSQNDDIQNIYLTSPPILEQNQPVQPYQFQSGNENKIQLIKNNNNINNNNNTKNNNINLPNIQSTNTLKSSHYLSPHKYVSPNKKNVQSQNNIIFPNNNNIIKRPTEFPLLNNSQTTKNLSHSQIQQTQLQQQQNQSQLIKQQQYHPTPAIAATPTLKQFSSQVSQNSLTPQQQQQQSEKNSVTFSHRNSSSHDFTNSAKRQSIVNLNNQRMSIYALQSVVVDEEQQKIDQIIQEIDVERNDYAQEKKNIKQQLELISQHYDKEMSKYSKNDNIDSIRGIQSDIPQHQYHSGLKIYQKFNKGNR